MRFVVSVLSVSALAACTLLYGGDTDGVAAGAPSDAGLGESTTPVDSSAPSSSGDATPDANNGNGPCDEPGLVLRLKLDEGSGDSTLDCSPTRAVGRLESAVWTDGVAGKAVAFDAGWVSLGNPAPLQLIGELTVTAWIYTAQFPATDPNTGYVVGKTNDATTNGWRFAVSSPANINFSAFGPVDGGSNGQGIHKAPITGLTWTHVAVTFTGGKSTLFVNGVNAGSKSDMPNTILNSMAEVRVGARADGTNEFSGAVDDLRMYNRVLSDPEIAAIAQR